MVSIFRDCLTIVKQKKGICIMLISVNDVGIHKYLLSSLELVSCVFSPFRAIERQRSSKLVGIDE
jgi:hypothetical protein